MIPFSKYGCKYYHQYIMLVYCLMHLLLELFNLLRMLVVLFSSASEVGACSWRRTGSHLTTRNKDERRWHCDTGRIASCTWPGTQSQRAVIRRHNAATFGPCFGESSLWWTCPVIAMFWIVDYVWLLCVKTVLSLLIRFKFVSTQIADTNI